MTTLLLLLAIVAAAGIPYIVWTRADARKRSHARQVEWDVSALGDVVPTSIHPQIDLDLCIGSGACVRACPEHDIIAITDGRARLVNPMVCVGHGACAAACPVGAISLVFGTATRGVELPQVSPVFETSRPGIYIAGELGGMGLIRNAVAQGRQAVDAIKASARRGRGGDHDVLVVGAGPAGISATLAALAHDLRVLLVDQATYGGTIRHYPRHKLTMTGTLDFAGYGKVRRKTMTKEALVDLWMDIRDRTNLPILEGIRVESIEQAGASWRVKGPGFDARAASVVLALGRRGAPMRLGVPGEDAAKVVYRVIEPEPFEGKHVLVVGGGNSAADSVLALADYGKCASVGISYRRAQLARVLTSVRDRVDALIASGAVKKHFSTEVTAIGPNTVTLTSRRGVEDIENDLVVVQIGGTSPVDLLKSIGINLVMKRGEA